jgi:hypothetical protein
MMISMLAVFLLAADAAPPPVRFYLGAGFSLVHTDAQQFAPSAISTRPDGVGFSLEAEVEVQRRFFVATSVVIAQGVSAGSGPDAFAPTIVSGRAGLLLLRTAVAPYVAAGAGWLRELLPDGDDPPNQLNASGPALLAEVGVQATPAWSFGKGIVYLQLLDPLFDSPLSPGHATPSVKLCWLGGARLLF